MKLSLPNLNVNAFLTAVALNHVQSTSHAPPATASVNQGVVIAASVGYHNQLERGSWFAPKYLARYWFAVRAEISGQILVRGSRR
jgi:hypothetical protein